MELTNEFVVGVGPKEAWALLTDVERIAPCMPGAELQEVEGDDYRGVVKVKVGPITAQYKGKATFVERDEEGYRAVLRAEGRETRGQGNANATITATLLPEGEGTRVNVLTDLTITGRAAQFGRGVLADVSTKLMGQFVSCLETNLLGGEGGAAEAPTGATDAAQAAGGTEAAGAVVTGAPATTQAEPTSTTAPTAPAVQAGPRQVEYRPAEPVDLLETAGAPVAKRLAPVVLGVVLFFWVRRRLRRSSRGRA